MRFASLLAVVLLPGCQLWFGGGDDHDEPCLYPAASTPSVPHRLVNPETLACQEFIQPSCNDECGPCPGGAIYIPPWGQCESPCIGLSESACMADDQCRVARSYNTYYTQWTGDDVDDYMGCYPINTGPVPDVQRCEGLDAEQCAWQSDCTALYDGAPGQCNALLPEQCLGAEFRQCIPQERTDPGECVPAGCREEPPPCPSGTTPGVANSCYTGACIPNALCGASAF